MALKRKRAPGGGRKPQGPTRKESMLQARIPDDLLASLDQAAAENGRSRSLEAHVRLKDSFDLPKKLEDSFGEPVVRHLAQLIAQLVMTVQRNSGADPFKEAAEFAWHRNPFTHAAVCTAINVLLAHYKPDGPIDVPDEVKRRASWVEPDQAERVTTPESVGQSCALGFITQLAAHREAPSVKNILEGARYGNNYHLLPRINSVLGEPKK
jgi:hypothetical protein